MTRSHKETNVVTGEVTVVPYTQEEEAKADAAVAKDLADKPLTDWLKAMAATDDIPRPLEDIYDVLTADQKTNLAKPPKDKILAKKALRGQKP